MPHEIMNNQTATTLVNSYNEVKKLFKTASECLSKAKEIVRIDTSNGFTFRIPTEDKIEKEMKEIYWSYALSRTGLEHYMSRIDKAKFDRMINNNELPEFSVETIHATLTGLVQKSGDVFKKTIVEVFEWLRNNDNDYATNKKNQWKIGEKAIIRCAISERGYLTSFFNTDIDSVFHVLDGKGFPKYPNNIETHVKSALNKGVKTCTTPYFDLKWFKNGNCHVKFLRTDLVDKLNELATSGTELRG